MPWVGKARSGKKLLTPELLVFTREQLGGAAVAMQEGKPGGNPGYSQPEQVAAVII